LKWVQHGCESSGGGTLRKLCLFAETNYSSLCALANQNIGAFIELIREVFFEALIGIEFRVCNCYGKWRWIVARSCLIPPTSHFKNPTQSATVCALVAHVWIKLRPNPSRHLLSKSGSSFFVDRFPAIIAGEFDQFTPIFVFV
jgi:hypothetical protein